MKLGNVYRQAAADLDRRGGYIYTVLGGLYERPLHPACKKFWELYEAGKGITWDSNNERVLALLFAAAIADSEGV